MANNPHPSSKHGKICYTQIPDVDIQRSASFFRNVCGWNIRTRGEDGVAFVDAVNEASGTWVGGGPPATYPTLIHLTGAGT